MATAPRVGQNNEKTMTREQRTMTWIGRTKTENKEKSEKKIKFPAQSDEHPRRGTSGGWRGSNNRCPARALPWQHLDWWIARLRDCATAGTPGCMFDHEADLTGLTGADRHAMKSRQSTCSSPRQGSPAHDGA